MYIYMLSTINLQIFQVLHSVSWLSIASEARLRFVTTYRNHLTFGYV